MLSLVKPRYFVPVHGEYRHLNAHAQLAWDMGVGQDGIFVLEDGDVLELSANSAAETAEHIRHRTHLSGRHIPPRYAEPGADPAPQPLQRRRCRGGGGPHAWNSRELQSGGRARSPWPAALWRRERPGNVIRGVARSHRNRACTPTVGHRLPMTS